MSKKHFEKIAEIIRGVDKIAVINPHDRDIVKKYLIREFLFFCSEHNPSFDTIRFDLACREKS